MGGLLAKQVNKLAVNGVSRQLTVFQAILLAHNERGLYDAIRESIAAVLFFGTPQSGSHAESFADSLAYMAEKIMFPPRVDQINEHLRNMIASSLRSTISDLANQREQYRLHVPMVKSVAFIEKLPLPGIEKVVSTIFLFLAFAR